MFHTRCLVNYFRVHVMRRRCPTCDRLLNRMENNFFTEADGDDRLIIDDNYDNIDDDDYGIEILEEEAYYDDDSGYESR